MNKILFLDIDGVLNSSPSKEIRNEWSSKYDYPTIQRKLYGLDPELVKLLKLIIDATNCKIVFSTSWRYFKDHYIEGDDWRKNLAGMLNIDQLSVFIGDTVDITSIKGSIYTPNRRGIEIKHWIGSHPDVAILGNYKYCVIDDEVCDIITVIPESKVVHTDSKYGIQMKDVERAIRILNEV